MPSRVRRNTNLLDAGAEKQTNETDASLLLPLYYLLHQTPNQIIPHRPSRHFPAFSNAATRAASVEHVVVSS